MYDIVLVYDRQCPVCEAYCRLVRVSGSAGELRIQDARSGGAIVDEITARGLDIDEGMVLKVGDNLYYGADAIHALALLSSRAGVFNRINYWFFSSGARARLLYPVLRFFRNLLLKMLRRTRINNLGKAGNERF